MKDIASGLYAPRILIKNRFMPILEISIEAEGYIISLPQGETLGLEFPTNDINPSFLYVELEHSNQGIIVYRRWPSEIKFFLNGNEISEDSALRLGK